jgi:hypothetical protein
MPRPWVLANVEQVGRAALNLADYWEYGRFLEVLDVIGAHDLLRRFVEEGLRSQEFDVRDIAELWSDRAGPGAG